MQNTKTVTSEPIIMDPVYVSVDIGVRAPNEILEVSNIENTKLMLVQEDTSRANSNDMVQKVIEIFKKYFNTLNARIGMNINLTQLSNEILSTQGISTFYTFRPDTPGLNVEGLSLTVWNPIYKTDITQTTQNLKLPDFKFPYFNNLEQLGDKIVVYRASDAIQFLNSSSVSTVDGNLTGNVQSPDTLTY